MGKEKVHLYDTTLRDGTQGEEIAFTVEDKLRITERLDEVGMAYIEGGWPGSNPRDLESQNIAAFSRYNLKNLQIRIPQV